MSIARANPRSAAEATEPAAWPIAGRYAPSIALFLILALSVLASDLLTKHLAFLYVADEPIHLTRQMVDDGFIIPYHEGIDLAPSILQLKLTINRGAVFGMGQGNQAFFAIVSVLAVGVIGWVFWISKARAWTQHIALALVLAGALGNLYDRIVYNGVRDMLYLFPGVKLPFGWHWAGQTDEVFPWIFNIADVSLLVGVSALLLMSWFGGDKPEPTAPSTRR